MPTLLRNVRNWLGAKKSLRPPPAARSRPRLEPLEDRTVPVLIASEMPAGMVGGEEVATLSGFVYCDDDGDGLRDEEEPGIGSVPVTLSRRGRVVAATLTGDDGSYRFADLRPGRYAVTEGAVPAEAGVTGDGIDTLGTIVGPGKKTRGRVGNDRFTRVVLRGDQAGVNYNFAERCEAASSLIGIEIKKFANGEDADTPTGPTVPVGSTVTFTYRVRNTGDLPLADVTVVDDNGTPGNPADDFRPRFVVGDADGDGLLDMDETWSYEATAAAVAGQYRNVATVTGRGDSGTVTDANVSHYFAFEYGQIDVLKFNDLNGNGVRDAGEPGLAGVTVQLFRGGTLVGTQMTMVDDPATPDLDEQGGAWFVNLAPGAYTVRELVFAGFTPTTPTEVEVNAVAREAVLAQFGNRGTAGQIDVLEFDDRNGNGVRDADEPGLVGVTFELLRDGVVIGHVVTVADDPATPDFDEQGGAWFVNLAPGAYTVRAVIPVGSRPTTPTEVQVAARGGEPVLAAFGDQRL